MKNPFVLAPRCVQWAAVSLAAIPVFQIVVDASLPFVNKTDSWLGLLPSLITILALAAGLIYGLAPVRLIFAAMVLFMIGTEGSDFITRGLTYISPLTFFVPRIVPIISLILCVLPKANLYFSGEYEPEEAPKTEEDPNKLPKGKIALVILSLIAAIMLKQHYTATHSAPATGANATLLNREDAKIAANVELLHKAYYGFEMMYPNKMATYEDLVGPKGAIESLKIIAGEKYPEDFGPGIEIKAVLPDGSSIVFDEKAYRAVRRAKSKMDERTHNIKVEENIGKLTQALDEFLLKNPGKTAGFYDLVGPGKAIPKFNVILDETYPQKYPPGEQITATLPNGVTMRYGFVQIGNGSGYGIVRESKGWVSSPEPLLRQTLPPLREKLSPTTSYETAEDMTPYTKLNSTTLLEAVIRAHRDEHDDRRQLYLTRYLTPFIERDAPNSPFLKQIRELLEHPEVPKADKDIVFKTLNMSASNPNVLRFLIRLATTSPNPEVRGIATAYITTESDRAHPLKQVWCECNDPRILSEAAIAMAKSGTAENVQLLLDLAFDNDGKDPVRTPLAYYALPEIKNHEATEVIIKKIKERQVHDKNSDLLIAILFRFWPEEANKAVIDYIKTSLYDMTPFIKNLGSRRPRNLEMLAASAAALKPGIEFANEANRDAIKKFLAPPAISYSIENGSFETGAFHGFTLDRGDGKVVKSWKFVGPTEQRYMAMIHTMEDARDGISILTSDDFYIPTRMRTLLFDYRFTGSVLLNPPSEMVEVRLIQMTDETESYPIKNLAPKDAKELNLDGTMTGWDRGTGFKTTGINVERWAGSNVKFRIEFTIKGRGALPEHIPGMNKYDHSPMGSGQPGTALFIDNIRFSAHPETSTPKIEAGKITISSPDNEKIIIQTLPGAIPPGSQLNIWEGHTGKHTVMEPDQNNQITFAQNYGENETNAYFFVSYETSGSDGSGRMISPQIRLDIRRDAQTQKR